VQREGWQRFTIPAGSRYTSPGSFAGGSRCLVGQLFHCTWVPSRPLKACGFKAWAPTPFKATSASWTQPPTWARSLTSGPNWVQTRRGAWPLQSHRHGLQPNPRRRHDLGRHGAVCRRPQHLAQHRQLAGERNRPHRRHGHRSPQTRRPGGRRPRTGFASTLFNNGKPPASTPTTTTASPCVFRWPASTLPVCRCASKTRNAWPKPSPIISRPCSPCPTPPTCR
jgi:hypothetical protein